MHRFPLYVCGPCRVAGLCFLQQVRILVWATSSSTQIPSTHMLSRPYVELRIESGSQLLQPHTRDVLYLIAFLARAVTSYPTSPHKGSSPEHWEHRGPLYSSEMQDCHLPHNCQVFVPRKVCPHTCVLPSSMLRQFVLLHISKTQSSPPGQGTLFT